MSATSPCSAPPTLGVAEASALSADDVLARVATSPSGLSTAEAARRLAEIGPNALRTRRARAWPVLGRQLRSPILVLLFVTALVSVFLGEAADALIVGVILVASIGLGFVNEYRAARAADSLHDRIRHSVIVRRDGVPRSVDVTVLVPGDIALLATGSVVPADMRLIECHNLACDEAIITGESIPAAKSTATIPAGTGVGDLRAGLLMGTVVQSGSATAVVVATGRATEFGRIAAGVSTTEPETEFQRGLAKFSLLLLQVAAVLTSFIFIANVVLQRPILESLLFSLAIAVGITPQLLPAVVSTSLATGSRVLTKRNVLVKRLVCIEDLGDLDLLVTDKTGTLTEGRISFTTALPVRAGLSPAELTCWGLRATEAAETSVTTAGLNAVDAALWEASHEAGSRPDGFRRIDLLPFDHERRMTTVLGETPDGRRVIVTKGAPEDVMRRCSDVPPAASGVLAGAYGSGARVIAVATTTASDQERLSPEAEAGLSLQGFLLFLDRPKSDARASLRTLATLGVSVKVATGDSAVVAEKVLADIGLPPGDTLSGSDLDAMGDDELAQKARTATIFARVSPEQKARVVRLLRHSGRAVGFLGDGVNDALALHQADIGISVDSAADVAKDAADVLLLEKDLGVLAEGVREGRRIFANTIKYVLMGTSSNFGNMFSAAVASLVLPFLPMLPSQILVNNLLYDSGQLAIPGDRVDPEQLVAPAHWDIRGIRRFMLVFGPISSVFDFATFALMLGVFHAGQSEFQSGWFIESLATQTLIVFAIRTHRTPFLRSRPSTGLIVTATSVIAIGVWLPSSPLSAVLGFQPLPVGFFLALVAVVVLYLVVVELAKHAFYARLQRPRASATSRRRGYRHRVTRRASRFNPRRPT